MEAVPYAQYKTYSTYAGGMNYGFWVHRWTRYAQVPQGSSLSLLATSSAGGNGYSYEIDPNGMFSKSSFTFYPGGNQIGFNADTIGQHILLFIIDGQVSNAIVIDIGSYYPPPYQQPAPTYSPTQIQPPTSPSPIYGDTPATIVLKECGVIMGILGWKLDWNRRYRRRSSRRKV